MAEPLAPPDGGSALAWARQIDIGPSAEITVTVDEDTLELLIAAASDAGLTTMMLFLTRVQARRLAIGLLGAVYESIDNESWPEVERDLNALHQH